MSDDITFFKPLHSSTWTVGDWEKVATNNARLVEEPMATSSLYEISNGKGVHLDDTVIQMNKAWTLMHDAHTYQEYQVAWKEYINAIDDYMKPAPDYLKITREVSA